MKHQHGGWHEHPNDTNQSDHWHEPPPSIDWRRAIAEEVARANHAEYVVHKALRLVREAQAASEHWTARIRIDEIEHVLSETERPHD